MTIPEIIAQVGTVNKVEPEWLTVTEAEAYTRLGKTAIYKLLNEGHIKSIELKVKKSNLRGTRLIYLPSLREFMMKNLEESKPDLEEEES